MIPYDDSQIARLETLEEAATNAVINHEHGAITLQDAEVFVARLRKAFEETESPGIVRETNENAAYFRVLQRLNYLEERLTLGQPSTSSNSEAMRLAARGLTRYLRATRAS